MMMMMAIVREECQKSDIRYNVNSNDNDPSNNDDGYTDWNTDDYEISIDDGHKIFQI